VGTLGEAINLFRCCVFTLNAFTVVLPAFLIAGAVVVFVPSQSVMKYFGAKANRFLSYGVSAVSGNVLTVCSCNVVPIFAGILRRGAGIGPAFCFVFAAPAIHIVNTVMTYQVIGPMLALWRFVSVPILAVIVGLIMAAIFRKDERARQQQIESSSAMALVGGAPGQARKAEAFLGLLILILIFGAWFGFDKLSFFPQRGGGLQLRALWPGSSTLHALLLGLPPVGMWVRLAVVLAALVALVPLARRWFGREETAEWGRQTWLLARMILPIFIPAVIAIALIVNRIPLPWIMPVGGDQNRFAFGTPQGNHLLPVFAAALFSTLMYFPMLTEVVFTKGLLLKHFAVGPALALLLGGPGLSLPGLLLVARVAGWKKTVVYWAIMVVLITLVAWGAGSYYGEYICSCMLNKPPGTAETDVLSLFR
jgi:uncharacterized membrane protein YraQ (UPF0718 family)